MTQRFLSLRSCARLLAGALLLSSLTTALHAADSRCFELRTYYANPGKLDALHARFRDHTVALFEKHGMTNAGYWVPVDNAENTLVYLMAYPSREARDRMWKAFLNDPKWKAAFKASTAEGRLVGKVESRFMELTAWSPALKIEKASPERLFELRVYTTNDGKLDNLNARFRDHTVRLFEQHGMTNVGYWSLQEDQPGADNTLLYLLAHKDRDSRNAAFKAFAGDPAWQKARKESEANGKLLVKGGVQATFLDPTDYSPMK